MLGEGNYINNLKYFIKLLNIYFLNKLYYFKKYLKNGYKYGMEQIFQTFG